jgi:hypothetical protein
VTASASRYTGFGRSIRRNAQTTAGNRDVKPQLARSGAPGRDGPYPC